MKKELQSIAGLLTICLEAAIEARDKEKDRMKKHFYRSLAKEIEDSLTALESAINLIGE
jgi:hypothetical protein